MALGLLARQEDAMKIKFQASRIGQAALLAAAVMIAAPACAAQTYPYPYRDRGQSVNPSFERRVVDDGYRRGFEDGRNDARKHRSFAPDRHGEYRDAQRNVYRGDWNRQAYGRSFTRGYESGYREGFGRFNRGYWRD